MKLFVYANTFEYNGEKLLSAGIGVREGEIDCKGIVSLPTYHRKKSLFEASMELVRIAIDTRSLLENLGHEIEVEDMMRSSLTLNDYLEKEFDRV